MNELLIKVNNLRDSNYAFLIDGEEVRLTYDSAIRSQTYRHKTENEQVELRIIRYNELKGALWLLMSLVFFFVSIFGIFGSPYDGKGVQCNCLYTIKLSELSTFGINILKPRKKKRGYEGAVAQVYECNGALYAQHANLYFCDKIARRRYLIAFFIKLALFIAAIALAGVFGLPYLINAL